MKHKKFYRRPFQREVKEVIPHNEGITAPEVRVVDAQGMVGVMPTAEAIALARERNLDLVMISPGAVPPVAKIIDYTAYKYQKEKEEKKKKASAKQSELKILRLSPRIGQHDLEVRLKKAKEFLEDGDKVKIEILLKGREKAHADVAFEVIKDFVVQMQAQMPIKIESHPSKMGAKIETTFSAIPK